MVCNADDTVGPWLDVFGISAEKQLSKYAEWTAPRAGMFLWLKLTQVDDSMDIFEELKAAKVVVVPGDPSCANKNASGLVKYNKLYRLHTSPLNAHITTAAFQAILISYTWLRLLVLTVLQTHSIT